MTYPPYSHKITTKCFSSPIPTSWPANVTAGLPGSSSLHSITQMQLLSSSCAMPQASLSTRSLSFNIPHLSTSSATFAAYQASTQTLTTLFSHSVVDSSYPFKHSRSTHSATAQSADRRLAGSGTRQVVSFHRSRGLC